MADNVEKQEIQPKDYTEQVRSNFNILFENMVTILENEYNLGRVTGDEYVKLFNSIMQQTLETSRLSLFDYFNSMVKKEELNFVKNSSDIKIDGLNLSNKKLKQEIEQINVNTQLNEIKTKNDVRRADAEIDERYANLQLTAEKYGAEIGIRNAQNKIDQYKVINAVRAEKMKVVANIIGSELQAWSMAVSSGELDNEEGLSIIPDVLTNSKINDTMNNFIEEFNYDENFEIENVNMNTRIDVTQEECDIEESS